MKESFRPGNIFVSFIIFCALWEQFTYIQHTADTTSQNIHLIPSDLRPASIVPNKRDHRSLINVNDMSLIKPTSTKKSTNYENSYTLGRRRPIGRAQQYLFIYILHRT